MRIFSVLILARVSRRLCMPCSAATISSSRVFFIVCSLYFQPGLMRSCRSRSRELSLPREQTTAFSRPSLPTSAQCTITQGSFQIRELRFCLPLLQAINLPTKHLHQFLLG